MRLRNQMKMIAHQNKAQHDPVKTLCGFTQQSNKPRTISLSIKHRLPRARSS